MILFTKLMIICLYVDFSQSMIQKYSWGMVLKPIFNSKGQRILISCAAGESRSVSIAICATSLFESMEFYDACKVVFKAIPRAYPHPNPLVSVGKCVKSEIEGKKIQSLNELRQ